MTNTSATRWWFIGVSGSGKTTYARGVASALGVPHLELDSVFHQPHWEPLATEEFRSRVRDFATNESWTIDGNYRHVRDVIFERVQVIVAIDLPKAQVMRQVVSRTIRRRVHNEELWNGNREAWSNMIRWDPEKSIIRWAWTNYDVVVERINWYEKVAKANGIVFLRARSHEEVRQLIAPFLGEASQSFLG